MSSAIALPLEHDLRLMCYYCFDTLASNLEGRSSLVLPSFPNEKFPLFVTWDIEHRGTYRLRGCIGNFRPMPLHRGLKEYAIISALEDHRFSPVVKQELPRLKCSVSLLVCFEAVEDIMDWDLEVHGVRIEFTDDAGHSYSATFLPDVALNQGWTKQETIDALIRKSGYGGRSTPELYARIKLTRYQSVKLSVTYGDFQEYLMKASLLN